MDDVLIRTSDGYKYRGNMLLEIKNYIKNWVLLETPIYKKYYYCLYQSYCLFYEE
jgi:hypothetical protein